MKTIALFFALTWGAFAQGFLPFNQPLQQNGTTVQLQLTGTPGQIPDELIISVIPADPEATSLTITVAIKTVTGRFVCTVSGIIDPYPTLPILGIALPSELLEVSALKVVTTHDTEFGFFPSTCARTH
jgi:hypothetical protein